MPLDPRIPLMADQIVLPDRLAGNERRQKFQMNRMAMEAEQAAAARNAMARQRAAGVDFTDPVAAANFSGEFGDAASPYIENAGRVQTMATAQSAEARAAAEEERKHRDAGYSIIGRGLLGAQADPSDASLTAIGNGLLTAGVPQDQLDMVLGPIMRLPPEQRGGAIQQVVASNPELRAALEFVSPKPVEVNLGDRVAFIDANPNSPTYNQEVRSDAVGLNPNAPPRFLQGPEGQFVYNQETGGADPINTPDGGQLQNELTTAEQNAAAATAAAATKARANAQSGIQRSRITRNAIAAALDQTTNLSSGFVGSMTQIVPGSPAADLDARLNTIRANIAFDQLQEMRQNSPTGGALGNVSDTDMALLQSTLGSLSIRQSPEQLAESLRTIDRIVADVEAAFQADLATFGADAMSGAPAQGGGYREGEVRYNNAGDGVRYTNGQWVPL